MTNREKRTIKRRSKTLVSKTIIWIMAVVAFALYAIPYIEHAFMSDGFRLAVEVLVYLAFAVWSADVLGIFRTRRKDR